MSYSYDNMMSSINTYQTVVKPSIRKKRMEYKYWNGQTLFHYFTKRSAQYLISNEWNTATELFSNLGKNSRALKDILKQWNSKRNEVYKTEEQICNQLTNSKIKYNSLHGKQKVNFWTQIFNNINNINNSPSVANLTDAQCLYYLLGIVEIDKLLYPLETALYSTQFFKAQEKKYSSSQAARRLEIQNYVKDYRKKIKGKNGSVNISQYTIEAIAEELGLNNINSAKYQFLEKTIDNAFTDFKKSANYTNAELFSKDFKSMMTKAVSYFCQKQGFNDVETINLRIQGTTFMSIDIKASQDGDILRQNLLKGNNNFATNLSDAIKKLKTSNKNKKHYYLTISGKKIFFDSQIKNKALKYLNSDSFKKFIEQHYNAIASKGHITGNIGEISAYLKTQSISVFKNVQQTGKQNEFADLIFETELDSKMLKYGLNVRRYSSQINNTEYEIYREQEINSRNFHYFLNKEEIRLLKYLKMNYNLVKAKQEKFTIYPTIPNDDFKSDWENLLMGHITDLLRITSSTTTLNINTNLFFVINDRYIPVSLVYDYIITLIKKDKNIFVDKAQGIIHGATIMKETFSDYAELDKMSFSATQRGPGDFTALFKGFKIDFKKLYSLN